MNNSTVQVTKFNACLKLEFNSRKFRNKTIQFDMHKVSMYINKCFTKIKL